MTTRPAGFCASHLLLALIHPARKISFDDLIAGLEGAKAAGHIASKDCTDGRRIYIYTQRCVYENGWSYYPAILRPMQCIELLTKRPE